MILKVYVDNNNDKTHFLISAITILAYYKLGDNK